MELIKFQSRKESLNKNIVPFATIKTKEGDSILLFMYEAYFT